MYIMFRLRYFTIACNTNEYEMMGQGASLVQLYDAHNEIKISKKHWLGLCFYYDRILLWHATEIGCYNVCRQMQRFSRTY